MHEFVAYYRVSTDRQGQSGLGLEAQRLAVVRFIEGRGGALRAAFQEIESGRRHTNRPELAAAVEECRRSRATLVIAKLDRLARDVHFIAGLMKSGVEFVAVDMPEATPFMLHIYAAVGEYERQAISERTKAALDAAKARGTRLGNPRWEESLPGARAARKIAPLPPEVVQQMVEYRAQGWTFRQIASQLENMGVPTQRGRRWHPERIRTTLARRTVQA